MCAQANKPHPGELAVLISLPPGLIDGLPIEDQVAIREMVGKPILLIDYAEIGRAELEFRDKTETLHHIWVKPEFLRSP
jgi:hypothetical protein